MHPRNEFIFQEIQTLEENFGPPQTSQLTTLGQITNRDESLDIGKDDGVWQISTNHAPPGPITCSSQFTLNQQFKVGKCKFRIKLVLILKFSLFILLYFPGLFVPGFLGPGRRVRRGQITVEAAEEKLKMLSSIWYFVFFKDTRNILGQLIDCGVF